MDLLACTGCGKGVSRNAEICPDCGYPVLDSGALGAAAQMPTEECARREARREYGWIQLLGVIVFCAGIAAAMAEFHIAAVAAMTTGVITFIVGLMGHWWTRH
jgi:hypothetical protein